MHVDTRCHAIARHRVGVAYRAHTLSALVYNAAARWFALYHGLWPVRELSGGSSSHARADS